MCHLPPLSEPPPTNRQHPPNPALTHSTFPANAPQPPSLRTSQAEAESRAAAERAAREAPVPLLARLVLLLLGLLYALYAYRIQSVGGPGLRCGSFAAQLARLPPAAAQPSGLPPCATWQHTAAQSCGPYFLCALGRSGGVQQGVSCPGHLHAGARLVWHPSAAGCHRTGQLQPARRRTLLLLCGMDRADGAQGVSCDLAACRHGGPRRAGAKRAAGRPRSCARPASPAGMLSPRRFTRKLVDAMRPAFSPLQGPTLSTLSIQPQTAFTFEGNRAGLCQHCCHLPLVPSPTLSPLHILLCLLL